MEQLNRIEIKGTVGSAHFFQNGSGKFVRLSVYTNFAFKDRDGNVIIETTWHNVIAFAGKNVEIPEGLSRYSKVHIIGRIRNQKYTDCNGEERTVSEIYASELHIIETDQDLTEEYNDNTDGKTDR